MPRPTSTRSLFAKLTRVFAFVDQEEDDLEAAQLMRLAVLFEDLRIETTGLKMRRSDPFLADCSPDVRIMYFLRRSLATLYEFNDALYAVSRTKAFKSLELSPAERGTWDEAVCFFQKHNAFINRVRNDVGGHYGKDGAMRTLKKLDWNEVGGIQAGWLAQGEAGIKLMFAAPLTATCLLDRCEGTSTPERVDWMISFITEAYNHAIRATEIIAVLYYWPRFERAS